MKDPTATEATILIPSMLQSVLPSTRPEIASKASANILGQILEMQGQGRPQPTIMIAMTELSFPLVAQVATVSISWS